ncbi:MAG: SF1B family DNA helicase RecD2 [Fibrobacterota bacterium]
MDSLAGVVSRIVYMNEENGFAVLSVFDEESGRHHTVVGDLAMLRTGETLRFFGSFVTSEKWGDQFRAREFEYRREPSLAEMEYILGAGLVDGIGGKRAEAIVEHFGADTFRILDEEPDRLREVAGIGRKRHAKITASWQGKRRMRELFIYLQPHGVSLRRIQDILKQYGDAAKTKITENPYRLIDDIRGIGFKTADAIARSIGYESDSYRRIGAALKHCMKSIRSDGHLWISRKDLLSRAAALLGGDLPEEKILFSLDTLINEKILTAEDDAVYQRSVYQMECTLAEVLAQFLQKRNSPLKSENLRSWITDWCEAQGIAFDEKQFAAVDCAVQRGIMVLTGGPGTGKTTTVKLIVDYFRQRGKRVALTAPTGRAAQKMSEVTGLEAKTIHRLLGYTFENGAGSFLYDADNMFAVDLLIIDEFSMVDLFLAHSLFTALKRSSRVIIVGDADQLPSVGAGRVLADLIETPEIPHVELTRIFRQAEKSRIVTASHEMIRGEVPVFSNGRSDNCFFLRCSRAEDISTTVIDLATRRLPAAYEFSALQDIQVITPMHRGECGTELFNERLRTAVFGEERPDTLVYGNRRFCAGDKVMQVTNNYEKQVFNGDIGFIDGIDKDAIYISFPSVKVKYSRDDLADLTHAYAITIHKSQGSEFPAVIIPVTAQHMIMLRRNLVYTALTRARRICILVGDTAAFARAVHNQSDTHRNSRLSARISAAVRIAR